VEDNNNRLAVEKQSAQAIAFANLTATAAATRTRIATAGRRKRRIEEEREGEFLDANHFNEMTDVSPHDPHKHARTAFSLFSQSCIVSIISPIFSSLSHEPSQIILLNSFSLMFWGKP